MGWLGEAGDFVKGAGEGAWDGVKGMAQGIGHLAEGACKVATDSAYRARAWNQAVKDASEAGDFADTAVTDPGKAAAEIGHESGSAWHSEVLAYREAEAKGRGGAFVGNLFGQGAVLLGSAFVPGVDEAEAAGAIGEAGQVAETALDAGAAAAATRTIRLPDEGALQAAAEHAEPNTRYELGNSSWTTDAKGRPVDAHTEVEIRPGHRDPALQRQIGKEGAPGDVGFHLIGDQFGGPTNRLNVVAGNGKPIGDGLPNLNQGAFKRVENQVAKLASNSQNKVEFRVQPRFEPGNLTDRPDAFAASYRVNDGTWFERKFANKR